MTDELQIDESQSIHVPFMSMKSRQVQRPFPDGFKQDAADLVVMQGYSLTAAAEAVTVSSRSLREWPEKLVPQPKPSNDDASVSELQRLS